MKDCVKNLLNFLHNYIYIYIHIQTGNPKKHSITYSCQNE